MNHSLKTCQTFDETQIINLIKKDYLDFCLQYDVSEHRFEFSVIADNNLNTSMHILGNGILGINLDSTDENAKSIVLSCGVHGNETAPIEICNDLVNAFTHGQLTTPHRILFIFGNIPSMLIAERFVEENLNRLFSYELPIKTNEGARAKELMDSVDSFFSDAKDGRYHYDLHTAIRPSKNEKFAVYPFLHGKPYSKSQLAFLSCCDVNTILLSQSPTTTFSYFSSVNYNAHAFTVELGKVMPFGKNDMSKFNAVRSSLINLITEKHLTLPAYEACPIEVYQVNQVINKQQEDFALHFSDSLANFESFKKDDVLASETGKVYKAKVDGEAVVFPNANVAIGQRAILTVVPHKI